MNDEERERQIADIEEEINHLHCDIADCQEHEHIASEIIYKRILAARQAALANLQRGLREPAQGKDAE